jgi:hypothetical protein
VTGIGLRVGAPDGRGRDIVLTNAGLEMVRACERQIVR